MTYMSKSKPIEAQIQVSILVFVHNPYTEISCKILQRLSPKQAKCGVEPKTVYSHLPKQLPWPAAEDSHSAHIRFQV